MGIAIACAVGLLVLGLVYITTDTRVGKNPLPPMEKKLLIRQTATKKR